MNKIFYYDFNKINAWLFFNLLLLGLLVLCSLKCPGLIYWWQMQVLWGTWVFSCAVWSWKYLHKQRLAIITDETITIDHCRPLAWKDIDYAEERIVRCGFHRLKIIVLIPKDGINYRYNFLQRHNGDFTAFSIPLYDIVNRKDAEEMTALIEKKVKLIRLP